MRIKLARCLQTVEEETENKKKRTKMARAGKAEAFVWTDNETELRRRLRFGKYADSPFRRKREGCVFGFLHPETRFQ